MSGGQHLGDVAAQSGTGDRLTGLWIWFENERRKVQVRAASKASPVARSAA